MSVEAIGPITGDVGRSTSIGRPGVNGADFADVLGAGLMRADQSLKVADTQLRELAAGGDIPIHDVMISMEKARVELMLVVEVRNRLLEGYQELMRMQL